MREVDGDTLFLGGGKLLEIFKGNFAFRTEDVTDRFVIMPYINMNDCVRAKESPLGKEVYLGDVVIAYGFDPAYHIIDFIEGGYCLTRPDLKGFPIDINILYPSIGCQIEVIGNVHELGEEKVKELMESKTVFDTYRKNS
jgi:hypothetical protein